MLYRLGFDAVGGRSKRLVAVACLLFAAACSPSFPSKNTEFSAPTAATSYFANARLSKSELNFWLSATQGSRLVPASWFNALVESRTGSLFASDENLAKYGFLADPDRELPIGFSLDRQSDRNLNITRNYAFGGQEGKGDQSGIEPWLGVNCAACHTGSVSYKGQTLRYLGAPAMIDLQRFVAELFASLETTLTDQDAWKTFSKKVLAEDKGYRGASHLRSSVSGYLAQRKLIRQSNLTDTRYGPGRVDAFGRMANRLSYFMNDFHPDIHEPNGPVNFPHLWNAFKQEFVQWNGSARNRRLGDAVLGGAELGALGRNVGQVLGVFGDMVLEKPKSALGRLTATRTSVNIDNLMRHENLARKFSPPSWPAFFPAIDPQLARRGREHYAKYCQSCHLLPSELVKEEPSEVLIQQNSISKSQRTDPAASCNAYSANLSSGVFKGEIDGILSGTIIGETVPVLTALDKASKGAIAQKINRVAWLVPPYLINPLEEEAKSLKQLGEQREGCKSTRNILFSYKARPLDGIWATAPYLHNGSVPTLYDLLQPVAKRPKTFLVGSGEFDPSKLGLAQHNSKPGRALFVFRVMDRKGVEITGNSNRGHVYGSTELMEHEKFELLEFLKTL